MEALEAAGDPVIPIRLRSSKSMTEELPAITRSVDAELFVRIMRSRILLAFSSLGRVAVFGVFVAPQMNGSGIEMLVLEMIWLIYTERYV